MSIKIKTFTPYPGYNLDKNKAQAFKKKDAAHFFGRQQDVDNILFLLRKERFIILLSKPKMGKTSIIQAGIMPTIEKGFAAQFKNDWITSYVSLKGKKPYKDLAKVLAQDNVLFNKKMKPSYQDFLFKELTKTPYNFGYILEESDNLLDKNLLLCVDDFDKALLNGADVEVMADFLKSLNEASLLDKVPFYVVLSLEPDGKGFGMIYDLFPELIQEKAYFLHRPSEKSLFEAITSPLEKEKSPLKESAWKQLINELHNVDAPFVELQRSMASLWKKRNNQTESFQDKGLVQEFIEEIEETSPIINVPQKKSSDSEAERIFENLSEEQCHITKRLFQALTRYDFSSREIRLISNDINNLAKIINCSRPQLIQIIHEFGENILTNDISTDSVFIPSSNVTKDWGRLEHWAIEESNNAKYYKTFCEAASEHFEKEKELYSVWTIQQFEKCNTWFHKNNKPTKKWGSQYTETYKYQIALDFLEAGLNARNTKNEEKEPTNIPSKPHTSTSKRKITIKKKR
ncbi:MAG: hypothetical protein ACPG5P_00420 [Saprospiraceae bacterium]